MKKLEVLIVEGIEENRVAAKKCFSSIDDVYADFAMSYMEGLLKIQSGLYALGIFDLYLPREEGSMPEKLGFELAREATKYIIPWAVITSGFDSNKKYSTFVSYCWYGLDKKKNLFEEIAGIPKTDSTLWQIVYESLIKKTPNIHEIFRAKEIYKKIFGKPYVET